MRNEAFFGVALAFGLGSWAPPAASETVYVTDSLRLGFHAAADTSDRPFDNLVSGTAVEVLERNSNYARVRSTDGREGWVKAMYLVELKPAAARVLELETEMARLAEAATAAKAAQTAAETELARFTAELQEKTGSTETTQQTLERLRAENRAHEERFESYRYTLPIKWVIPAGVVALVAGFVAGLWWLDALIRRRHGGFRVY
jgi:SH3 domain protein